MRIARVFHDSQVRLGVVADDGVRLLPGSPSLVDWLERDPRGLAASVRQVASSQADCVPLNEVRFLAPVDRFRRDVLCTGWNYYDHFTESIGKREGQEVERPKAPAFFTKSPDVVIGPTDPIAFDARISKKWDYEAEVAVIIGKAGRSIPARQAMDHVWGYCLANDVSQRDLQRRHGGQWLKGKSLDGTMPLGPWVVTADEVDLPAVRLKCLLNGQVMQDAYARQMVLTVPELVAELSLGMTLRPGDVLLTGTPSGIGNARNPPVFLKAGDELVVQATGLGELRNRLESVDLYGESSVALDWPD
ncbi:MAG TPA: fumarylacetoacetate hydrolase family protein [Castellaniella sp.]|uniref:fumarylacetoacetate hydrolase family protein n=1 Tax=Castellaniella sp. TaxID=1955812 RepID=UPI002EFC49F9